MSLIAFASAKFSPGCTTLAELVVLRRPTDRRCLLVNCDPAGSEWLLRPGVVAEPGLVTLAMAGRRDLDPDAVLHHAQVVGEGLEVLVAPAAARQAASALDILGDRLGAYLASLADVDVVADCGRLQPSSPAMGVLAAADLAVLVGRPAMSDMVHLAPWVEQLSDRCRLAVALIGSGRSRHQVTYEAGEIADAMGVPVLGVVADDATAAARLFTQPGSLAGLFRSRLVRSASSLSATVFAEAGAERPHERRRVSEEAVTS